MMEQGEGQRIAVQTYGPDAAFDRDMFYLRQKVFSISSKYFVSDEAKQPILFVERPARLLRNLGAILLGLALGIAVCVGLIMAGGAAGGALQGVLIVAGILGLFVVWFAVAIKLSAKRHLGFYRDETKQAKLLDIEQEKKAEILTARYTVRDPSGQVLARFHKNYLSNIIRSKWTVFGADGQPWLLAIEDSLFKALLRRFVGPLYGILRTNFIIEQGGQLVGKFDRQFTITDRYVLDMRGDPQRTIDRRVALALGVMLDTGERR